MYFVKLWITISAPTGETDKERKCYQQLILNYVFGDFDKPAISATSNNGLLTVSHKTFVSGVMAASTASSFVISTNVVLISNLA
jgi:hypothetical protein